MLIRRGARGQHVREIQVILNRIGFGPLAEDAIYGRGCESAIRLFQKAEGLGVDGIIGPNTMAALRGEPTPNTGQEPAILGVLRAKGYTVFDDGQVNIIGVRSSNAIANSFDDEMHLVWKKGSWNHKTYPCTCDPGTYYLEHPMKVEGTAILCPGQYPVYKFDKHRGTYVTLCQRAGPVKCWRDNTKDSILDHTGDPSISWGINIHHAGTDSTEVQKWSAGCQVFKRLEDWSEAVSIWKSSGADLFTYTLIDDTDLTS